MMNAIVVTKEQKAAVKAIETINAEQYVDAVFAPFNSRLADAIKETQSLREGEHDLTTTASLEIFKKARALFKDIRLDGDKTRKATKEPFIAIGKFLEAVNNTLETEVTPHEEFFDKLIKAEEARKEEVKAAAVRAESIRLANLEDKVNKIKNMPLSAVNLSASDTHDLIAALEMIVPIVDVYEERTVEVEILLESSIAQLKQMAAGKLAQEMLADQSQKAAVESARIATIQKKIIDLKNYIIDAADIETVDGLEALIKEVAEIQITNELFAEFASEAETTRTSVFKSLARQLASLKYMEIEKAAAADAAAEAEAATKAAVDAQLIESKAAMTYLAATIEEPDHVVEVTKMIDAPLVLSGGMKSVTRSNFPPDRDSLVNAICRAFGVPFETAEQWLLAQFGEMKAA
jgi:hypothetical protein